MNVYSLNFKKKFLKNIFVKWCKSVISVKVIDFIEEYRLHFYYVITLIKLDRISKKVFKKIKNEENTV